MRHENICREEVENTFNLNVFLAAFKGRLVTNVVPRMELWGWSND